MILLFSLWLLDLLVPVQAHKLIRLLFNDFRPFRRFSASLIDDCADEKNHKDWDDDVGEEHGDDAKNNRVRQSIFQALDGGFTNRSPNKVEQSGGMI